jgi:hypothetical protein
MDRRTFVKTAPALAMAVVGKQPNRGIALSISATIFPVVGPGGHGEQVSVTCRTST